MLNFCGIVVAILKMATDRNFSELIPDIEQFLLVAIFKMATTISQKFNFVQYLSNCDDIAQC
jgi:hypothetical protein